MLKNRKIAFVLVAIFALALLLGGCGAANTVGVLDVQKVMTESPKVKQLQEQLNTKAKELSDQLEKDKATMSADEFQKRQETVYGEFMKTKQDLESQIDASIKQTLEQMMKDKKLGVVIYKNSVAAGGVDITEEVINKMQ